MQRTETRAAPIIPVPSSRRSALPASRRRHGTTWWRPPYGSTMWPAVMIAIAVTSSAGCGRGGARNDEKPALVPSASDAATSSGTVGGASATSVDPSEELRVSSGHDVAAIPSMPMSQLLGKTRADIETLFHPSAPGHAKGWVRYNEHLELRYEGEVCVEMLLRVGDGLTCTEAARWVGFAAAMAPIHRARKCLWPPNSLKHSLGRGVSGELSLADGIFAARGVFTLQ